VYKYLPLSLVLSKFPNSFFLEEKSLGLAFLQLRSDSEADRNISLSLLAALS